MDGCGLSKTGGRCYCLRLLDSISVGAALKSQGDGGPAYQEHHDNWQYLCCSGTGGNQCDQGRASLPPS